MEELAFRFVENNKAIDYKYFGSLNFDALGVGIEFDYPEINTKSNWYSKLIKEDTCSVTVALGCLYYYLKELGNDSFIKDYSEDLFRIINSTLYKEFIDKWFENNGSILNEPCFFDCIFGRFSNNNVFSPADNADDEISLEWIWAKEGITIIFPEECGYGEWSGKIFIDACKEDEFKYELNKIIELFNPYS